VGKVKNPHEVRCHEAWWKKSGGLWFVLILTAWLLLAAAPAFSQSCSLCYTQAASSGSKMIHALKSGILILVIPPTLGSIGMIFVVHRRSHKVRRIGDNGQPGQDW
jgi:hypothetical protein